MEVSLYGKLMVSVRESDRFRRMPVYRGAGLDRCMY